MSRVKTVAGQDGCTPIPLGDNIVMWTFGDTILGSWKNGISLDSTFENSGTFSGLIQGSAAFTEAPDDNNFMHLEFKFLVKNGKPAEIIKRDAGNDKNLRFWTVDGIRLGNSVFLYYMIMEKDPSQKEFPFKYTGMGLAKWDIPSGWKVGDDVVFEKVSKIFYEEEASFGDSVIIKDGYLYLIGHKKKGNDISLYITRARIDDILLRNKYMFLKSDGSWSNSFGDAGRFFSDIMGEPSLSYNEYLKSFIIIYCSSKGSIKLIKFREFSGLQTAIPSVIYEIPKLPEIKTRLFYFYYSGKEIFYTQNAIYAVYMNPAIYQPILLKIPYESINK